MFATTTKTICAAAAMAAFGTFANAATVAELTAEGQFSAFTTSDADVLGSEGTYTAFLDTGFDPDATNDFLFEIQLEVEGLGTFEEDFEVTGVTGNDLLGIAVALISDIDVAFPGAITAIIDEVSDTDGAQTEIFSGLFLSLDLSLDSIVDDTGSGAYNFLLSNGAAFNPFDRNVQLLAAGAFSGSATISTVAAVPLPAGGVLLLTGLAGMAGFNRRKKRAA